MYSNRLFIFMETVGKNTLKKAPQGEFFVILGSTV